MSLFFGIISFSSEIGKVLDNSPAEINDLRVGDIILYQERYYGVQSTVANQYWGGKNPAYPNNVNPLNPGLENYGNNVSVLVSTYYIPADKVAISPYQERF